MIPIRDLFGIAVYVIEAVGVIIIVVGIVLSAIWFVGRLRRLESLDAYQQFRQDLARSIILGLEFLIAGDIIRTVTVEPTLTAAAVLALIVLIRVMLSLMLEFEIEGRWPWQRRQENMERVSAWLRGRSGSWRIVRLCRRRRSARSSRRCRRRRVT